MTYSGQEICFTLHIYGNMLLQNPFNYRYAFLQKEDNSLYSYENQSEWVANASYADHKDLSKNVLCENESWIELPKDVEIQKVSKISDGTFGAIWKAHIRGCDRLTEDSYFVRCSTGWLLW